MKKIAWYQIQPWLLQAFVLALCIGGLGLAAFHLQSNLTMRGLAHGYQFLHNVAGFDIAETAPVPTSPVLWGILAGFVCALFLAKALKVYEVRRPQFRGRAKQFKILRAGIFLVTIAFGAGLAKWGSALFLQSAASGTPDLGESSLFTTYDTTSSYALALATGLTNTLKVAGVGLFCATLLGFLVGIFRVFGVAPLQKLAAAFVTLVRGVPLLLQLAFWYVLLVHTLPLVENGFSLGHSVYLNNRGLFLPQPIWGAAGFGFEFPELVFGNRNIRGGITLSPEFVALLLGLSLYHSAYISEIVRAGIASVAKGQREAAASLGLSERQSLQKIVLPQALRVMIPNLVSQGLSLTKNSSLAVAIGYRDLVSVGNTVINQSGQAVEVIGVWMLVYLGLSLSVSLWLNLHLRQIQPRSRS